MENKHVVYLLLGISILVIIIIFMFNSVLKDIVRGSCTLAHGDATSCPMYQTINQQTSIALGIIGLLIIVSLVLIFSRPQTQTIIKTKTIKEKQEKKTYDLSSLRKEDRSIFNLIKENNTIFQADLIEKSGFGKAKVSRILDRLENRGLIERKRRGMTNVVVLK